MYILTDLEKHNLEMAVLNSVNQIMHLETLLQRATKHESHQLTTIPVLGQLENAQRTLDNLTSYNAWEDKDSDVQAEKVA